MDWLQWLFIAGGLVVLIYVITHLKRLFAIAALLFLTSVTALFVYEDVLKLPVRDYVDVRPVDKIKHEGPVYVQDALDDLNKKRQEILNSEEDGSLEDDQLNSGTVVKEEKDLDKVNTISYEGLTEEDRLSFVNEHEERLEEGKGFRSKLMGMSPYVDTEYDLGNAVLRNDENGSSIILEYVENEVN